MESWLLIQVKPRQEMRALANLESQGATCFCPQIEVEKLACGNRVKAAEPLFPGYLFLSTEVCDSDDACKTNNYLNYTNIRSSRGVSKIVSFGGEPFCVSQSLIDQLRAREAFLAAQDKSVLAKNLPLAGDKVEILEGSFKGLEGIYSHVDGQERSVVLITLLSQQTPALLNNHKIRKVF